MNDISSKKIIEDLRKLKDQKNIEGMARFGINTKNAIGISIPELRRRAKVIGTDHQAAIELWKSEIHEAKILATMIDDPNQVNKRQMESWVKDFNSWDLCDQCCNNLFRKSQHAIEYSFKWPKEEITFTKRAGFVMIAVLALHSKELKSIDFEKYFPLILNGSSDERNFVKKAVNWALRQIGKRNLKLNSAVRNISSILIESNSKSAKWIGKDALRELTSERIINSLK